MSASNRDAAIRLTLGYEGGYTNDPQDPGGPTNWGITIYDARLYWKPNATAQDVKDMPKDVAVDIYRQKYWAKMNCDNDPPGVDFATFDYGVNSGVGRAIPCRERHRTSDPIAWAKAICDERLEFLKGLKTWQHFGRGWEIRVKDVRDRSSKMAAASVISAPFPQPPDIHPVPQSQPINFWMSLLTSIFSLFKKGN